MSDFRKEINTILLELEEILVKKNLDYGNSFDTQMDEFGLVAGVIRLNDKLSRLKQLNNSHHELQITNESIYDTVKDTAGYAILLLRWLDKELSNNN